MRSPEFEMLWDTQADTAAQRRTVPESSAQRGAGLGTETSEPLAEVKEGTQRILTGFQMTRASLAKVTKAGERERRRGAQRPQQPEPRVWVLL